VKLARRRFTLVELLVALSLGAIILGIIAGVSQAAAGSRELSLARIERVRQVEAALDGIARDWERSLLLPVLPSAHGKEGPPLLQAEEGRLSFLVLEDPVERLERASGETTPVPVLRALSYQLTPEADSEGAFSLLRSAPTVAVALPPPCRHLSSDDPEVGQAKPVLDGVVEFEVSVLEGAQPVEVFCTDECCGPATDLEIRGFELRSASPRFDGLREGTALELFDRRGRDQVRFNQGAYRVRSVRDAHTLVLDRIPGNVSEGVGYRAVQLPRALSVRLVLRWPVRAGRWSERVVRRSLVRWSQGDPLVGTYERP